MIKKVKVSSPGKIILSGEHSVVYGYPAILAVVDRRLFIKVEESRGGLKVFPLEGKSLIKYALEKITGDLKIKKPGDFKIQINSEILRGCGMGSSAAFAVSITAAIFKLLNIPWDLEKINQTAYEIEKKQHGNPSGGDNTISTYGGFLWYRKETEKFKIFSRLKPKNFPRIFLINSGKPVETTGEMVTKVKEMYLASPNKIEKIFQELEKVTRGFLRLLLGEELPKPKDLLTLNEKLLEQLGVVSESTKILIRGIEKIGGAAKISGAGGVKKGSGIVLAYHKETEALLNYAKKENLDIFKVKLGGEGVRSEIA